MELRTQFAQTADGVTVAYVVYGSGPALVSVPSVPFSNLELETEMPGARQNIERVGQYRTYVRFDLHGFGLSQREASAGGATDFSLDACVRDITAVVDRVGCDTFALEAMGLSTPIAIAYAAQYPERVTHLVLGRAFSRLEEIAGAASTEAIVRVAEEDWTMSSETLARVAVGWGDNELATQVATIIRASTTPAGMIAFFQQAIEWDVRPLLPRVTSPALLVAHREGAASIFRDPTRRIAASLPNATLVEIGPDAGPDAESRATWAFLGVPEMIGSQPPPTRTVSILFADIADSTSLTEKLGDALFRSRARELDAKLRSVIRDHGGRPVEGKLLGDGVLATFLSARDAVRSALDVVAAGNREGLPLHAGVHAGDVIFERGNVFGGAVNVAARIADEAEAGELLVSDTVRALARTSLPSDVMFENRGERALKGVGDAYRLYALRAGAG